MASNSKFTNDDFQKSTSSQNQDGNKCSICLNQIKEDIHKQLSGKCQICLDKIKAVPSGFPFVLAGEEINEFECPICSLLIRNATELKCEHLFCEDCLTYYEKDQLNKDGDAKFFCPVCQAEYKSKEKFNVRSTDKVIQTSLRVKCLQKECEWTGCIKDYKNHSKKCEFLEVECPNKGCIYQVNAKEMEEHLRVCFYRQVECEYCNKECSFTQLKEHYNNCEGYPIPCNNLGCPDNIQRSLMENHLENCEFAIVSCPFLAFGCTEKIQRRDIEDHNGKAKSSHDTLLFQMVNKMKHENIERDQKIQQQDQRIEELENIVTKNEEEIKELQNNSMQQKASITKDLLALADKNQSIEDSLIKTNSMTSNIVDWANKGGDGSAERSVI